MQTLRQIKTRIRSIANTQKITSAMQLVSAAKLSRSKAAFHSYRLYERRLESILKNLAADSDMVTHPLLREREDAHSIALVAIASDSGLCGPYNYDILNTSLDFLNAHRDRAVTLIAIGQEALKFFKKSGVPVERSYLHLYGKYDPRVSNEITHILIDMLTSNRIAEAYIAYTRFRPSQGQAPTVERFLPIQRMDGQERTRYIVEPDRETLLDKMISQYLEHKVRSVLLESFTSENFARMFAMKNATDNASELIDTLTLQRNKARQAAITQEVTEIAMSAEALKG